MERRFWGIGALLVAVVIVVLVGIGLQLLANGIADVVDVGEIRWGAWLLAVAAGVAVYAVLIAIRRVIWPPRPASEPRSPGKVEV